MRSVHFLNPGELVTVSSRTVRWRGKSRYEPLQLGTVMTFMRYCSPQEGDEYAEVLLEDGISRTYAERLVRL